VRLSVQREIMCNVRWLGNFAAQLGETERARFEVRLYDASASITLYRWDDRALVSFLPIRVDGVHRLLEERSRGVGHQAGPICGLVSPVSGR